METELDIDMAPPDYDKKMYTARLFPTDSNIFDAMAFNVMRISKNLSPEGQMLMKSVIDNIFYRTIMSEFSKQSKKFVKKTMFKESTFEYLSNAFETVDNDAYIQNIITYANRNKPAGYGSVDWFGNSCYQDAVILALFAMPVRFIVANVLYKDVYKLKDNDFCTKGESRVENLNFVIRLQMFLRQIAKKLWFKTDPFKCFAFRQLTTECKTRLLEKFTMTREGDAPEFLKFLFEMFDVPQLSRIDTSVHPQKSEDYPIVQIFSDPNLPRKLSYQLLYNWSKINEKDENELVDFIVFNHIKDSYTTTSTELIPDSGIDDDPFIIDDKWFRLHAVVMYKPPPSPHYTVIINLKEDTWVYFNDIGNPQIKEYHSYKSALDEQRLANQDYNIKSSGVLYFYRMIGD